MVVAVSHLRARRLTGSDFARVGNVFLLLLFLVSFCIVLHYAGNWNGMQERFSLVVGMEESPALIRSLPSAEHVV